MESREDRPKPIQFRLATLLAITAAVATLFGTLRWMGVPAQASLVVLVVLVAGSLAAFGLVLVIASSMAKDQNSGDEDR
jgi:hypothetical protein